ncbi:MAG TPA: hypothetical protein VGD06_14920 [Acidobacteriota bacterium]
MNRLVCPHCGQASYCASLTGPVRCANSECGALLIPGGEVEEAADRRLLPRLSADTRITVEFLDQDRRVVEQQRSFLDVSIIGISTVLDNYPPLGADVIVELSDAGLDGKPWRVRGIVREVQPADGAGYRVGIEVLTGASRFE